MRDQVYVTDVLISGILSIPTQMHNKTDFRRDVILKHLTLCRYRLTEILDKFISSNCSSNEYFEKGLNDRTDILSDRGDESPGGLWSQLRVYLASHRGKEQIRPSFPRE